MGQGKMNKIKIFQGKILKEVTRWLQTTFMQTFYNLKNKRGLNLAKAMCLVDKFDYFRSDFQKLTKS